MSDINSPEPAATEPPTPPAPAAAPPVAAPPEAAPPAAAPPVAAPPEAAPPAPPKSGIAVAALVIGIVAAVFAIIPGPSFGAFVPAILAAVLGIVALTRKTPRRGFALAGVILGAVSLLVAIIVSIGAITGAAHNSSSDIASDGAGPGSSSSGSVSTPKVTPSPTPTVAPVPADASFSGSGDSIIPITLPDGSDSPGIATITNSGGDNFVVWSLDSNVQQLGLLVNTIGGYKGTVLFDIQSNQHTAQLQITSSGSWTVTLHSIRALRQFTEAGATGSGDDVLVYDGKAGGAKIHNDGGDNFVVWEYGNTSNLAVNEIGAYDGVVRWAAGPSLVAVTSTGNWSIALQ